MYPIPANATRIRYLEATSLSTSSGPYVNTGFVPTSYSRFEIEYANVGDPSSQEVMNGVAGGAGGSNNSRFAIGSSVNGRGSTYFGVVQSNIDSVQRVYSQTKIFQFIYLNGTSATYGTNSVTRTTNINPYGNTTAPVILFGRYGGNGVFFPGATTQRIFWCKLWRDSSTIVHDFVPVRIGQTGYLFDRVSGQLFGNAGTGSFVLGPDTFQQGVIPTRMMPMGLRKKEALGSVAFSGNMDSNLEWSDLSVFGPGNFTFSSWVKAASTPTRGAFAKIGERQVGTTPGAGIGLGFGSSRFDPNYTGQNFVGLAESVAWANSPSNAPTINSWYHYAAMLSGYVLSVYIDGTLFWTNTFSSVKSMSPFTFYLGGNRGGNATGDTNRFLACNMTRSAFWNRALSASQVAQDYADGKKAPTVTSGLQHYWPMSNVKNYLKDEIGSATLTAGSGGVTISTDTPFA